MRTSDASALAVFLLASVACEERVEPGQSSGPGAAAREALLALSGREFVDLDGVFGGGRWRVGEIVLSKESKEHVAPHVDLIQGERRVSLPMLADGDAADLVRRVSGNVPPQLASGTSANYRDALAHASK